MATPSAWWRVSSWPVMQSRVEQGFIYVRGGHRLGYERFSNAVQQLEQAGYFGEDILGSGWRLRIDVRRGAGAYVCGEETALIESIEGKRGVPRLRPPFPTTPASGVGPLWSTTSRRWARYRRLSSKGPAGTATSAHPSRPARSCSPSAARSCDRALRGAVRRPLRHLVYDLAGGLHPGRTVQAVLTGGAAGTFLTAEHLDTPLTFEDFKRAGGTIGAGRYGFRRHGRPA